MTLSPQALQKIDKEINKYPAEQKQSAVMAALAIAQTEKRWLAPETIAEIATYLEMPAVWVQEVATFYNMYHTQPVGEFTISVCTNLPCALSGGEETANALKELLAIDFHQTTSCSTFTIKESECMGACGDAPVVLVNNHKMHSFVCASKVPELLACLKNGTAFKSQSEHLPEQLPPQLNINPAI